MKPARSQTPATALITSPLRSRDLRRRWWALPAILSLLLSLVGQAGVTRAATFTVCASGCDYTTVQAAVNGASAGDTISLAAETFAETVTVDRDLTIQGAGTAASVIDGGAAGTVLTVQAGTTVTLTSLTIRNGRTTGNGGGILNDGTLVASNLLVTANVAATNAVSSGGGIYSTGSLTLTDSTVSGNEAQAGGGGIDVLGASATAQIDNVTITNNAVHEGTTDFRGGGGIKVGGGQATISRSDIGGNTTQFTGGGVAVLGSGATVTISDSWVHGNTSRLGGGIVSEQYGHLSISGSTISGNTATGGATAIGGGILAQAPVSIENSTVAGNTAQSSGTNDTGGGILAQSTVTLDSVTVVGNAADNAGGIGSYSGATTTVTDAILAGNSASAAANGNDCGGTLAGGSALLISDTTGCTTTAVTNVIVADPLLGSLQDNGGPTLTMLPGAGSPAIDAGATTLTTDQRGETRPVGAGPDIGAVEVQAPALPSLSIDDVSVTEGDSGTTDATFTISLSSTAASEVTVDYATADGTAVAPGDYTATSGTATIGAGASSTTVAVPVVGDTVPEADETFSVVLSNPVGATLATATGTGTVINDDAAASATPAPTATATPAGTVAAASPTATPASLPNTSVGPDRSRPGLGVPVILLLVVLSAAIGLMTRRKLMRRP